MYVAEAFENLRGVAPGGGFRQLAAAGEAAAGRVFEEEVVEALAVLGGDVVAEAAENLWAIS